MQGSTAAAGPGSCRISRRVVLSPTVQCVCLAYMVQLDIGELKSGTRSVSKDLTAADLGLELARFKGLYVSIEFDREGDRIVVQLEVSGTAHLICDRTSEPFDLDVRGSHALVFIPHDDIGSDIGSDIGPKIDIGSDAESSGDVLGFEPSDPVLDVTDIVRDTLLLSLPTRRLAPGAEEADVPMSFGLQGENDIDPRWEGLRALKDESSQES